MAGDGPRGWSYLRCDPNYRAAWRDRAAPPGYAPRYEEDAPFPVRIQSRADLVAVERWTLLAWQDPFGEDGPASAFFDDVPMLDGAGSAAAPPLLPMLADAGTSLEGLRLTDGTLVLKVEKDDAAIQVRVTDDAPLMAGGGVRLRHDWGLRLPVDIARLTDLWIVSGGPVPRSGIGGRDRKGMAMRSF